MSNKLGSWKGGWVACQYGFRIDVPNRIGQTGLPIWLSACITLFSCIVLVPIVLEVKRMDSESFRSAEFFVALDLFQYCTAQTFSTHVWSTTAGSELLEAVAGSFQSQAANSKTHHLFC